MKPIKVKFFLTAEELNILSKEAEKKNITLSQLIREYIGGKIDEQRLTQCNR